MKTRTRSRVYLSMAAMMLTATVAVPTAARHVPFKGAFSGQDTASPGPSATELLDTAATGTGTHLGQFSLAQVLTVNLANHTAIGSARWMAANGDYIDTTVVSAAEPADMPDLLKVTEINTITGGTGRFTGAEGSFTVERLHNLVTSATFGSFHGTITSTGAAR
jgi:hypothetical protein